ncbi:Na+/melibiose symporter-like transporter [Vogesella indigofera]|uniref:Na+/melibiose symporter-like transporter n=1 Tax=Vogesella indigofera TaxID=45465 RepID=A0A495BPH1_VOGIN|nr:MFS transporter [Vogesella indigofera]RKQ63039.1 Na+/melibiose symporter-like transporter [Vogesella indigofera]
MNALSTRQLALSGLGGLPLAMVALPLYVHTPALYAADFGVALASLGWVLLLARLFDTAIDPLLGLWQDRLSPARARALLLLAAGGGLAGFGWLVMPQRDWPLLPQLAAALLLVYLAHGWLSIALLRYGAALWPSVHGRSRVAAWREGWALLGVLLAAALPATLAARHGQQYAMQVLVLLLLLCSVLCLWLLRRAPLALPPAGEHVVPHWRQLWRDAAFRRVLLVLLLNATAMAIPATLLNFYIADLLRTPALAGLFLLLYFLAAVLSLPLWVRLADRIGRVAAWRGGMLLALLVFLPVLALGEGQGGLFALVCLLTGAALGADLAFGSALVADVLGERVAAQGGAAFGAVSMMNKLALACAAGLALPLAAQLGYQPGGDASALPWLYAGLPALFKLAACLALPPAVTFSGART